MKKFYLSLLCVICILCFKPEKTLAQCLGTPVARAYNLNGICVAFVGNSLPNAPALLLDLNLTVIGSSTTDAQGFAAILYPCGITPFRVSVFTTNPSQTCNVIVPPAASLPVKINGFSAQIKGNNSVMLTWKSTLELNSYTYTVEKSVDGKNFVAIGEVKAAGNSSTAINYSFSDDAFTTGNSFFRLKQVDKDGKFEYSRVIYVNNKRTAGIVTTVAPNPFTNDIQLIGINSAELNSKNIRLYNTFGQMVNYRITGSNALTIDPSAAKGMYILKIKEQTFKIQKN